MSDHRYRIGSDLMFKESDKPLQRVLRFLGVAFVTACVLALVLYGVFAITVNTDMEGRLKRENKMYEKLYPQMLPSQALLDDVIAGLEVKDGEIYSDVFHSNAPSVDPIQSLTSIAGDDTAHNDSLITYASAKSDMMFSKMYTVEANLRAALSMVANPYRDIPPMRLPIDGISFTQIGASVGSRTNPVLKARVGHSGLDIIVSTGTAVKCAGDGKVTSVEKKSGGFGNVVTITHPGGYVTRYAHLSTVSVRNGQKVRMGQKIGAVGMSGKSFAPHLHYEVLFNGQVMDPVNYIFASVDPVEYADMFYMAANTEQSMD